MKNKYKLRELTPKSMICSYVIVCPAIYEDKSGKYLIIGKKANPSKFGLKKKVGKDEVLISVPKELIDNKRK